jgi:hypothetical protein
VARTDISNKEYMREYNAKPETKSKAKVKYGKRKERKKEIWLKVRGW